MEALMMEHPDKERATQETRAAKCHQPNQKARPIGRRDPAHPALPRPLLDRDETDPRRCAVELVQRGRMIVDVSAADLEAAESAFGPFHPTTWHFRNAWNEAQRSWERLRAELGTKAIEAALEEPSLTVLRLGASGRNAAQVLLVSIAGQTYRAQQVPGTELAPIQWRLTRLHPPLDDGPYYVCKLADGSTQCDCAEWTYRIAQTGQDGKTLCKHLAALTALSWI
jgi:hypothetical protein